MLKRKIYTFINFNSVFLNFIYSLILLNVISIILESYAEIRNEYGDFFYYFEFFSVIVFSIEYLLRLWTANLEYKQGSKFSKRIRFVTSKYGIIDLLAILPFYLPLLIPFDLRALRMLRLFRLLRVFKLGRLSKSMRVIGNVLKDTKADLSITFLVAFILLILSSTLMFSIENEAQPDKFENIGQSMWWAVATLTTVGYGDIYPITGLGKIISSVIALIGIGFVALPTGIISSAFIEKIKNGDDKGKTCECPKCGHKYKS